MPKPTKGPRLGGSPTHERMMLANMASQLFEHGRITTTLTRAKRVQPLAERLISKAKRGDLHSRRVVMKTITDKTIIHVLFTQIAPSLATRDGGCTRVTKVGPRKGDNAPMAIIEIVTEEVAPKKKSQKAPVTAPSPKVEKDAAAADEVVADDTATAEESVPTMEDLVEVTEGAAEESSEMDKLDDLMGGQEDSDEEK